jgi:hypothetical protein
MNQRFSQRPIAEEGGESREDAGPWHLVDTT